MAKYAWNSILTMSSSTCNLIFFFFLNQILKQKYRPKWFQNGDVLDFKKNMGKSPVSPFVIVVWSRVKENTLIKAVKESIDNQRF